MCNVATSLAFYRSQKGLSLENSEKSLRRGSQDISAPGSTKPKKSRKRVENEPKINSVQTRCIVKGEAQKSPLFWQFSGVWFSQDRLFSRNPTRKPLNLIKSPIFSNTPCKSTCLYNAPSMHTVEKPRKNLKSYHVRLFFKIFPGNPFSDFFSEFSRERPSWLL